MGLESLKGNTEVLKSMVDYLYYDMETGDQSEEINEVGYNQNDIEECGTILDNYIDQLIAIKEPRTNEQILECVKSVITNLNDLNDRCKYSLIETDQREDLVPYIINAALMAGLITKDDDITLEWREW